jgi:hypothetical protein
MRAALPLQVLLCILYTAAVLGEGETPTGIPNIPHPEVDFAPLRAEVARVLATPRVSPCVHPDGAVLVTYTNAALFPLLLLQRRALEVGGVRKCLQSRFITVCLDADCLKLCAGFKIKHCVNLGIQTVASPFLQGDYNWITYLKHEIMEAGLQGGADELFFFDGDVVLFGDPWSVKLQDFTGNFDLRYQVDNVPAAGGQCNRGVNSGQMYLRRTNQTLAYLAAMRSYRADILAGAMLDQNYVTPAAAKVGLQHCALDPSLFVGRCVACYADRVAGLLHVSTAMSMHADCTGDTELKLRALTKFVAIRTAVAELEAYNLSAYVTVKQALVC